MSRSSSVRRTNSCCLSTRASLAAPCFRRVTHRPGRARWTPKPRLNVVGASAARFGNRVPPTDDAADPGHAGSPSGSARPSRSTASTSRSAAGRRSASSGPNGAGKSSTMRMIGCVSPVSGGRAAAVRARPGRARAGDPGPDRRRPPGGHARPGAHRPRQPARSTRATSGSRARWPDRGSTGCWSSSSSPSGPRSKVEPLSGGMKRRLTIARSLVNEPELLLLDEPTTGLDPQARHAVWERLFQLREQGVTLVLTTHYMDEAEQLCDRLVVMDKGRIAAEGSPAELIREWSTREVVELRFTDGRRTARPPARRAGRRVRRRSPSGSRCCRTGCSCTSTTATRPSPRCTRCGLPAGQHAGAAQQPRGRLPAADRPLAGGLTPMAVTGLPTTAATRTGSPPTARGRRSSPGCARTAGSGAAARSTPCSSRC